MKLFEPLNIGRMVVPNRIMVPAMVTHLTHEDGHVTDNTLARYERYATGGAGLIVVEAMAIHRVKSGPLLRISGEGYIAGLRRLTERVHAVSDAKIVPQIIHFLKVARSGWRQTVDQLTREEIDSIIEQFGDAVARAREAGFDGAELHSAHAYTLSSFLSRANERTDEYSGQTLEGRLRLIGRVIDNVRRKAGTDFPLGVRFNGEEFIRDGYTVVESKVIALRLANMGADYLSVSVGGKFEDAVHNPGQVLYPYTGYSGERCMPGELFPPALHVPIADEIKAFLKARGLETPVAIAGKLAEPMLAERVVAHGRADIVGLARGLLADPDWPNKVKRGELDRIVQCDYCNVCKALDGAHKPVVCHLWPQGSLHAPPAETTEPAPRWESRHESPLQGEVQDGRVSLRWRKAPGAAYYNVFRVDDDAPPRLADAVKVTRWTDNTVAAGIRYRYHVCACSASGLASPRTNEVVAEVRVRDARAGATAQDH
jgi:dimethylglycine catabolism A